MPRKSPATLPKEVLVQRAVFLRFLRSRLSSEQDAEEVLQTAYLKGLKAGSVPDEEEAVRAWFFKVLRNALTDFYRRRAARGKAEERAASEAPLSKSDESSLDKAVCKCMHGLMPTLKAEYSEILKRAEFEEEPLGDLAIRLGVSKGTAAVRLHRARASLKKKLLSSCGACAAHGCLDCNCKKAA